MKRVVLVRTLAVPPHFGTVGDVLNLEDSLADHFIEVGLAELFKPVEIKERVIQIAEPVEGEAVQISGGADDANVDEHMKGLDDLFTKQHADVLDEAADAVEEPAAEEKKGKRK